MFSRPRLWLIALGAVFILVLAWVLLHAPPDGIEHGELSQFVGRFHPLVVHLPIALLLLVPLLEGIGLFRRWNHLRESAGFVLLLSSISAFVAVFLGWLLAWSGGYEGKLVISHMWGGFSLAVALFLCCLLRLWDIRAYRIALLATLALLIWTSDKGGKLTHGESFMTRHMPDTCVHCSMCQPRQRKSGRQSKRREQLSQTQRPGISFRNILCSASRSCL